MAEALTDYERHRAENIRRNDAILATLRRKAADLSAASSSRSPIRPKKPRPATTTPVVLRRSLRTRGLPPSSISTPTPTSPASSPPSPPKPRPTHFSLSDAFVGGEINASRSLTSAILAAAPASEAKICTDQLDAGNELVLRPGNVRRVVPERILSVRVLPLPDRTVVVTGNKIGHLGFWNVDCSAVAGGGDGAGEVFEYFPHKGPVSGVTAHPAAPRKIYSCSYQGEICLMDMEKEMFNMINLCDYPVFSLCQAPNNTRCLYFGEGDGELKAFDERMGKVSTTLGAHNSRINSIDFHPECAHMLATSSSDGTACIWDLRSMKKKEPESLKVVQHNRAVHSAYFSPSGCAVATTSLDDTVRICSVHNFDNSCLIKHNNQTGRWLSTFKAIWGWNDSDLFIGNMKRAIDIITVDLDESGFSVLNKATLESEHMTAIPCRFAAHPYKVGHLACSSSGGKVFLWTRA